MDFNNKKLLILGGNPETIPLVRKANSMGVRTIVTSSRSTDPAKAYSWKSYNVDGLDVKSLVTLVKTEKIDGVMVGVADILVPSYYELCNELSLYCYATREAVHYLTNKSEFKKQCIAVGLPIIPEYQESSAYKEGKFDDIPIPVVVKPVDSGGGVGISIVKNRNNLELSIKKALEYSHSKRIQIEKYMSGDIIACYYTIIDGNVYLSSLEDNYFTSKQGDLCPVTTGHNYVSNYLDLYFSKAHEKVVKMLNSMNVVNGILQINAFVVNEEFFFYDPGFRLQGEAQHHILSYVNGFDHLEMLIKFALTGRMWEGSFSMSNDPYLRGKNAASVWILLREGKISRIEGMDKILADTSVVYNGQRMFEESEITEKMIGTEGQVFSRIYVVCENKEKLIDKVKMITKTLIIRDNNGENMILDYLTY
jgi:biotin carboxylase